MIFSEFGSFIKIDKNIYVSEVNGLYVNYKENLTEFWMYYGNLDGRDKLMKKLCEELDGEETDIQSKYCDKFIVKNKVEIPISDKLTYVKYKVNGNKLYRTECLCKLIETEKYTIEIRTINDPYDEITDLVINFSEHVNALKIYNKIIKIFPSKTVYNKESNFIIYNAFRTEKVDGVWKLDREILDIIKQVEEQ